MNTKFMPFPPPHVTRKQAEMMVREAIDTSSQLTDDNLTALAKYLAPPKHKKVCTTALEWLAKCTLDNPESPLSLVHSNRGVGLATNGVIFAKSKISNDDDYYTYDSTTLLRSQYVGGILKIPFSDFFDKEQERVNVRIDGFRRVRTKNGDFYEHKKIGIRFLCDAVDTALNNDDSTLLQLTGKAGELACAFGRNEFGSFVILRDKHA